MHPPRWGDRRRKVDQLSKKKAASLSRREREMMDIIYEAGRATAAEVLDGMASPPSYSAVRATLRVLEEKRHLRHRQDGPRYVFHPTVPREKASQSALKHVIQTFFDGSTHGAVAALLDMHSSSLSQEDLERLSTMIEAAKKEGR